MFKWFLVSLLEGYYRVSSRPRKIGPPDAHYKLGRDSTGLRFAVVKRIRGSMFTPHIETILIAEPDQMLRRLEFRALSPYRIVQTSGAEEAVQIAARHETELDLLLTEA